jgi:hypothetical protein
MEERDTFDNIKYNTSQDSNKKSSPPKIHEEKAYLMKLREKLSEKRTESLCATLSLMSTTPIMRTI